MAKVQEVKTAKVQEVKKVQIEEVKKEAKKLIKVNDLKISKSVNNLENKKVKIILNALIKENNKKEISATKLKQINKLVNYLNLHNENKLNAYNYRFFINNLEKFDALSVSKIYKKLESEHKSKNTLILKYLGDKTKFPSFKEFTQKIQEIESMKYKRLFNFYDCLGILYKFNSNALRQNKAKKQSDKLNKI